MSSSILSRSELSAWDEYVATWGEPAYGLFDEPEYGLFRCSTGGEICRRYTPAHPLPILELRLTAPSYRAL
jgi:hypothetical protein